MSPSQPKLSSCRGLDFNVVTESLVHHDASGARLASRVGSDVRQTQTAREFVTRIITTPDAQGEYPEIAEAVEWARRACGLDPKDVARWNLLGVALNRLER